MSPVIHYYQHSERGGVHGFTYPLPKEIAKQVQAGELVKVANQDGTDPDTEIARLRAEVARLRAASGIDPSELETDGLADTPVSSAEPEQEPAEFGDDDSLPPDPDAEPDSGDGDELQHLCIECGDPVERKGKTGPWPTRHPGCK